MGHVWNDQMYAYHVTTLIMISSLERQFMDTAYSFN